MHTRIGFLVEGLVTSKGVQIPLARPVTVESGAYLVSGGEQVKETVAKDEEDGP